MPQTIDNMSAIWSNSLTTYTFLKTNITGPGGGAEQSAAGSLLMDLQVGGTSQFNVSKAGMLSVAGNGGLTANGNIFIRSASGASIIFQGVTNDFFALQSGTLPTIASRSNGILGWTSSATSANGTADTILTRRAVANLRLGAADTGAVTSTVTITIAAPGVVTWTNHTFSTGTPVVFTTTGALPTGITAGTTYYVVVVNESTFQLATSVANAIAATPTVITTSGSQSGTHTGTRYNITQRLSMQGITGVADRLGADLIIQGSQSTGDKAGGNIIFQLARAGTAGTSQNAPETMLTFSNNGGNCSVTSEGQLQLNASSAVVVNGTVAIGGALRVAAPNIGVGTNNIAWGTSPSTYDTILTRDNTGVLALRNGANAQTFRVYNTYTSDTNYESGRLQWVGNEFRIGPETVGGTLRSMGLYVGGTRYQIIGSNFNQFDQNIYMNVANIVTDTSTGFKIGTGTTQKIGFWNATPIAQPTTAVAAATVAATGTGDVVAASTTFDGYTIPQIVKALRNAGLLA